MNKLFALLIIAAATTIQTKAQDRTYNKAIGIRLGSSVPVIKSGISYQHFLSNNNAIEGIVSFGDGLAICGLYEIHKPIIAENLNWYIGFGGYAGFSKIASYIGAAGIVGLQYDFNSKNIPLNISLDWKPELNLIEYVGFEGAGVGFTARFTF